MLPQVFPLLANDSDVTSLIGSSPVRCYRHGNAPQRVALPYVTWFTSSDTPANNLDSTPPVDEYTVQVDCWSDDEDEAEDLATAVRDALETEHHLLSVSDGRDPETMRFRISMTFTFWTDRP